jgi:tRNA threonylcarbamoyladenosine biosynthesis protein TsaE
MTDPQVHTQHWRSLADTQAFAQSMVRALHNKTALRTAIIELRGDLGAGKTTFTRYFLQSLGVQGRIKSPTYALVEVYEIEADFSVWHFDFYRFSQPCEYTEAGFDDIMASPGIKLMEWPEKAEGLLPMPDLRMNISSMDEYTRTLQLQAHTPKGLAWLSAMNEGKAQ